MTTIKDGVNKLFLEILQGEKLTDKKSILEVLNTYCEKNSIYPTEDKERAKTIREALEDINNGNVLDNNKKNIDSVDNYAITFEGSYYSRYIEWNFRTHENENLIVKATLPSWWGTVSLSNFSYSIPFKITSDGTTPQNGYGSIYPTEVYDLEQLQSHQALIFSGTLGGTHHVVLLEGEETPILVDDTTQGVGRLTANNTITIAAGATETYSSSDIELTYAVCEGFIANPTTDMWTYLESGGSYTITGDVSGTIEYDNGSVSITLTNNGDSTFTVAANNNFPDSVSFNTYFPSTNPYIVYNPEEFIANEEESA